MMLPAALLIVTWLPLVSSDRLLSSFNVTIDAYGRSGATLYGMVECCEGSLRLATDIALGRDSMCRNDQDAPSMCTNVVKVGLHASPSLSFSAPADDPQLKKAAAMVNTALTVR